MYIAMLEMFRKEDRKFLFLINISWPFYYFVNGFWLSRISFNSKTDHRDRTKFPFDVWLSKLYFPFDRSMTCIPSTSPKSGNFQRVIHCQPVGRGFSPQPRLTWGLASFLPSYWDNTPSQASSLSWLLALTSGLTTTASLAGWSPGAWCIPAGGFTFTLSLQAHTLPCIPCLMSSPFSQLNFLSV